MQGTVSWLPWMEEHAGSNPVILTVHTAQISITVVVSSTLTTRTILVTAKVAGWPPKPCRAGSIPATFTIWIIN